jgi:hypothetical protein
VDSIATSLADKATVQSDGTIAASLIPALDATKIASGDIAADQLSTNAVTRADVQTISGVKTFFSGVRVDVAGDLTGLHLAGSHDDTSHHGGKLRLTKFEADKTTGKFTSVFYQEGGTQKGDTVLVSGCRVSEPTRGFRFQAFKTLNFDDLIAPSDVDTLGYITRSGFNCAIGEYKKKRVTDYVQRPGWYDRHGANRGYPGHE